MTFEDIAAELGYPKELATSRATMQTALSKVYPTDWRNQWYNVIIQKYGRTAAELFDREDYQEIWEWINELNKSDKDILLEILSDGSLNIDRFFKQCGKYGCIWFNTKEEVNAAVAGIKLYKKFLAEFLNRDNNN